MKHQDCLHNDFETISDALHAGNRVEVEGTCPKLKAQLDRCFFELMVDFRESEEREEINGNTAEGHDIGNVLKKVQTTAMIL
ncbi:MAG: hypothetical protein JWN86_1813 [Planctomycetota bacterium]|nr:hypothetical protein [Planctomycetota bacterium]